VKPPASYRVTLITPQGKHTLEVGRDEYIWNAASDAGIELPATCHMGHCLTCAGKLEGKGEVDQLDSRMYFPEDRAAGYVLPCTGRPRSNLRLRTHQADAMRRHRRAHKLPAPLANLLE
jgi:ferredoxin